MRSYTFKITGDPQPFEIELRDNAEAWGEAVGGANEVLGSLDGRRAGTTDWQVEVVDDAGRAVVILNITAQRILGAEID